MRILPPETAKAAHRWLRSRPAEHAIVSGNGSQDDRVRATVTPRNLQSKREAESNAQGRCGRAGPSVARNNRSAFSVTMTVAPVSASTAIHNAATPNGAAARNATFVKSAIATFCRITRSARRACAPRNVDRTSSSDVARTTSPRRHGERGLHRGPLERRAAPDEHAAPRRRRERRDDRHRRGDHERAGQPSTRNTSPR